MEYLQQVHEDQRGQQRQQDQQGPRIGQKTKEQILSMVQFFLGMGNFLLLRASRMYYSLHEHSQPLHGHQTCQQVQRVQEHQRVRGHRELQKRRSHHDLPMV